MELNVKELQKAAKASHTAEIVATALAMRERLGKNTNLPRYQTELLGSGERIDDKEYIQFWKDLEKAGVGVIVSGRGKKPTLFKWYYNLKEVAQSAVGGIDVEIHKIKPGNPVSRTKGYKKRLNADVNSPKVILRKAAQNLIKTEESPKVLETTSDSISMKQDAKMTEKSIFVPISDGSLFNITLGSNLTVKDIFNIIETIKRVYTGA